VIHLTTTIHRSAGLVHNNLQREAFTFTLGDDFVLRLVGHALQTRPTARHKFKTDFRHTFSAYSQSWLKRSDVVVSDALAEQALSEIREKFLTKLKWEAT
jgi:hypothetical protein